jgi:uncharacterized membrane protein YgcG
VAAATAASVSARLVNPNKAFCTSCATPTSNSNNSGSYFWPKNTKFNVYVDPNFTSTEQTAILNAINAWIKNQDLSSYNFSFVRSSGDPGVTANAIRFTASSSDSPNNLAYTQPYFVTTSAGYTTNILTAATVGINRSYRLGDGSLAYDPSTDSNASFFTTIVEHEFGHVLGLKDQPVPTDANGTPNPCLQTTSSIMDGYCGTNNKGGTPIALTSCDTTAVGSAESANGQSSSSSDPGGGSGGNGDSGGSGSGSGGGGGDVIVCWNNEEWDETTNTLYSYDYCS